jgi:hypothetical protein
LYGHPIKEVDPEIAQGECNDKSAQHHYRKFLQFCNAMEPDGPVKENDEKDQ